MAIQQLEVRYISSPYGIRFSSHFLTFVAYSFATPGDLYGGAHYIPSCSAALTPQGGAIQEAAVRFGDGATLPFTPCKKGYIPVLVNGRHMYACQLHNTSRQRRVTKEGTFRSGETDLNEFWSRAKDASKPAAKIAQAKQNV